MKKKNILVVIALIAMTTSCMDDESNTPFDPIENNTHTGLFIVNEGNFMYENASLSYYDFETQEVINDVFYNVNGIPLGDVAQSMIIHDSLGFIVVNNSGKVYVMNVNTFKLVDKITGLTSPRYMHFISDTKAYITDIYAKAITIVNPVTMSITGHININNHSGEYYQHSTEQMIAYKQYVFTNCWSYDNMILVIDTETDRVVDSIKVRKQPTSLVIDKNDKIWTITDGGFKGSPYCYEEPALIKIDAETRVVEDSILFNITDSPSEIKINGGGDTLYYLNRDVYRYVIASGGKPEMIIENPSSNSYKGFYGLAIESNTSDIYVSDALNMIQRGMVYHYTFDGILINKFDVGLIPGEFCFKK